jgi:hypothetical protein
VNSGSVLNALEISFLVALGFRLNCLLIILLGNLQALVPNVPGFDGGQKSLD